MLKWLVYETRDGKFADLIAAFENKREAEEYCKTKRKKKQYGTKKEYFIRERNEKDIL